ncbi:NADH-quinone oxidoreductase subunit J [Francisella philomiragia]|uniref:NADH-quinone oxidoreductase subunit J n=2 Tax=Francisella philomiragia TaxID=28110 RepID=A0ABS1GA89_9GAMM|nr:NADH-quinone oxidoreductase subunit J [Francisella philomiragia]AJI48197.1 NADH-ubiquinone/plastoquinone oxidoreductase chain 6 family protein [Francisella philomiragia]AJI48709.1 NADH-ubiquinone/plastoquinone oxidoreductase chain 6 family protein [Francisella philomiragia]AJI55385.1 NADH-ubiquinone/plastoquinone oxidoreductase chain 6 family protein [Francisella philomiragia]AJI56506.1 NADH-ubiquinone/plastoquinone oxidoreductase chain 6 family protein [Francisella philomiragia]AJI74125.1 
MVVTDILFYIFASLAIISALVLVLANNPVNSVIAMIFTFVFTAAVWIIFQQVYLALLLIVVYVGAVLVMFLFVVFMLDLHVEKQGRVGRFFYAFAAIIVCAIFATVISYAATKVFAGDSMQGGVGGLKIIGLTMFDNSNLYVFELVDFILLAAMTAAITLTLRSKRKGNKSVNPAQQVKVRAKDRLTMVKIPSNREGARDE